MRAVFPSVRTDVRACVSVCMYYLGPRARVTKQFFSIPLPHSLAEVPPKPLANWTAPTPVVPTKMTAVLTVYLTARWTTRRLQSGRSCRTSHTRSCRPATPRCRLDSSHHCPDIHLRAGWWPTPDGICHLRYKQNSLTNPIQWLSASTLTTQHKYFTNETA